MSGECNCPQCNNTDDPYANEHEENCCCADCHEHSHIASEYKDICYACFEADEEDQKESANGDGKQQES